jgi:tetratricopeptide (TPR) repeat protein
MTGNRPDDTSLLFARAMEHHGAGRLDEAKRIYRDILARAPRHAGCLHHLGIVALQQGDARTAETLVRQALDLAPHMETARNSLGLVLLHLGRADEAEAAFRAALALAPDHGEAQTNLVLALLGQNRGNEAVEAGRAAIALRRTSPEAWNNLGAALLHVGQAEEAEPILRSALVLRPDYPEARTNLADALVRLGRQEDADRLLNEILTRWPHHAEAHVTLALLRLDQGRAGEAEAACRAALALRPRQAEAFCNLCNALRLQNRPDEAIAAARAALALRSNTPVPQFHAALALALLQAGAWTEGWREFEWRRRLPPSVPAASRQPDWPGDDLNGRTLLLTAELGLGDQIQFARFAAQAGGRKTGGGRIVLETYAPLVRLFSTLPGVDAVVAMGEPPPHHDVQCPLLSLPHVLGFSQAALAGDIPYLNADPVLRQDWAARLSGLGRPRVGLVWAGDPRPHEPAAHAIDQRRSLPLARLEPLLRRPGIAFISVQAGQAARQTETIPADLRPRDPMDAVADFADTAALIANLDLVISVDTAVAHLAGAMGKPVWLLSRHDACWRWLTAREDSPWYPTLRLFRQETPGDWDGVVARLGAALDRWMETDA